MIPAHVVVTVVRFWIEIAANRVRVVRRWEVRSGAYLAVIDECPCGLHGVLSGRWRRTGKRTNCLCRNETCRNNPERRGVCHGWHQTRIDAMVAEIERPKRWKHGAVGVASSALRPAAMSGMGGYRWKDVYSGQ